jgi:hypothetical protein
MFQNIQVKNLNPFHCEVCHEYVQFVTYVMIMDGWLEHTSCFTEILRYVNQANYSNV